eukprot:TRINITY_DN12742_c0_g1_i1.p1 TRINITY_DN12742_c0_g1~~TRINITY_DN12742_c0_g1_i1.p1  ORF type:complete len:472 (-),score=87.29 TRINITY_DN12742_c0_g1_i1:67-1482(-)
MIDADIDTVPDVRQVRSWLSYEMAESAFNVASILIIPELIISMAEGSGMKSSWAAWFFANFGAVFLRMLCYFTFVPVADFADIKFRLFRAVVMIGSLSTILLGLLADNSLAILAVFVFIIAKTCQGLAAVFHVSFLNPVAKLSTIHRHSISSKGTQVFAASMVGFLICLVIFFLLPMRAIDDDAAMWLDLRGPLVFAGVWWGLFCWIFTFPNLGRHPGPDIPQEFQGSSSKLVMFAFREGLKRRMRCLKLLHQFPDLKYFIIACVLFRDAAATMNSSAAVFAEDLDMSQTQLGALVVLTFLSAIIGTLFFYKLNTRFGVSPKLIIVINLIFVLACVCYLLVVENFRQILVFGFVAGLNFGPLMAFIRSLYAQMIPRGFDAEFFSLFEAFVVLYSWISPLIIAGIVSKHGNDSFRYAAVGLIAVEFFIGIPIYFMSDPDRGMRYAKELEEKGLKSDTVLSSVEMKSVSDTNV